MAGLRVLINGQEVASVSSEGLNLISLRVHGDVVGDELASVELTGGNYGTGEADAHLTWINDHEISEEDVVEVVFVKDIESSHAGKTIKELRTESEEPDLPSQSMDNIFNELSNRSKSRDRHDLQLTLPDGGVQQVTTSNDDFSFGFSVMWKWQGPSEASVWLTSNSLEGIRNREDGSTHAKFLLQFGDSVKIGAVSHSPSFS